MPTTVKIPLDLLTVQVNSANAFWTAKSGTNIDQSYIAFVDSGDGVAWYWGYIPNNVATSPLWNLDFYHSTNIGSGGNAIVSIYARAASNTSTIDVAPTLLVSSGSIAVNSANQMTISAASGANFDSVVAVSATNYLFVKCLRHAGTSGDTLNDQWNLASMVMRIDLT